jgi:hypothetical protein
VVVELGLTTRDVGELGIPFWTKPSDQVTFQGPMPVRAALIVAEPPAQIAVEPETVAVGSVLTVTIAEPVAVPVQYASLRDVSV